MLGCLTRLIAVIRTAWRTMRPLPILTAPPAGLYVPVTPAPARFAPPPARPRQKDYG